MAPGLTARLLAFLVAVIVPAAIGAASYYAIRNLSVRRYRRGRDTSDGRDTTDTPDTT